MQELKELCPSSRPGMMSQEGEMLVCGSCKSESHLSCVSSPGLARLLNPFICSSCVVFSDRPGGVGGGFSTLRDRSSSLTSSLSSHESSLASDDLASPVSASTTTSHASSVMDSPTRGGSGLPSGGLRSPASLQPRPGGSIINPDQKIFESRDQFVLWAKAMFVLSPNKDAPMELKNT